MESSTGLVLVALFGLWIAYIVPSALRRRQHMKDSRADDRFSKDLRVLKVATPEIKSSMQPQPAQSSSSAILTPPLGQETRPSRNPQGGMMTVKNNGTARRAVLEQRAAAARRRAILTGSLLFATVVLSVVALTTTLSAAWIMLPAFLLASVLGLGRRAVILNQQNDERYFARLKQIEYAPRQMTETELKFNERKLTGRPVPAVRTGVPTGMAENVSTTVLSRVESSMFAKKHITGRPTASTIAAAARVAAEKSARSAQSAASQASARSAQSAVSAQSAGSAASAQSPASAGAPATARAVTTEPKAGAVPMQTLGANAPSAASVKQQEPRWSASPVPLPNYVSKSSAPRWETPGITTELQQITQARMAEIAKEAQTRAAAGLTPPATDSSVAADQALGSAVAGDHEKLSLNSILERRRAV